MRYTRFTINNYRAITGPLEINLISRPLIPIVGVNESGKTTILHALFAFDAYNDGLNDGRHLQDTTNLYRTSSPSAVIEAAVEMNKADLLRAIADCEEDNANLRPDLGALRRSRSLPLSVTLRRDLKTLRYSIKPDRFGSAAVQHALAMSMLRQLPYILFFDDFRDKVQDRIEIVGDKDSVSGWLSILEQLFYKTDKAFSVFVLSQLEERQRRTVLAKVQRRLNDTLTKQWQGFRLDERDALRVSIDYYCDIREEVIPTAAKSTPSPVAIPVKVSTSPQPQIQTRKVVRHFIKLDVVETDSNGDEHFFFISDRSKGFYWFFNFVMKLEFNPKVVEGTEESIYLLDEPGSYLHAFAQRKLCEKLKQLSHKAHVIYCTHSHYLLDPNTIPISRIAIAEKDGNGTISLTPITTYQPSRTPRRSALEPVLDALEIRPFALDLINTRVTVIVEGIYDYFALEMFKYNRPISILPSVGADSIRYYASLLIAWHIEFRALWDNDEEGRRKFEQASKVFGDEIAARSFRLLPTKGPGQARRIQDLFDGVDISKVRTELELSPDCGFERTLQTVFYSERRQELLNLFSARTKLNFEELYERLSLDGLSV